MASFGRNVLRLLRGSILGQLIALAALPALARLYSPESFGIAQAILSLLTLLLIVGSLRLEIAVLSVPERELADLFRTAWWLCLLTCGIALIVAATVSVANRSWSAEERVAAVFLPVLGLFACRNQLISYLALRRQAFSASSHAKVVQPAGFAATGLGLGALHASSASLLVADTLGRAGASVFLARAMNVKAADLARPSWNLLRATLHRHRELAGIGLLAALINAGGSAFTAAMLLWLFGAYEAGQYAMVERLVGRPLGLLAASVSQVFMATLSAAVSNQDPVAARAAYRRILAIQTATGAPVAILIFAAAPGILVFVLGQEWEVAGTYVQALVPLYLGAYVAGPLNMTLTVLGRQRLQLLWDCSRLAIVAVAWFTIWTLELKPEVALWIYSTSSLIAYAAYLLMADRALHTGIRSPRR